ncbi:MAG: hypothetical protein OEQ53_02260 [Saprospiraceae bacterium]|nr:hypothetical protein [Saprospiraceae bacterium]
MRYFTIICLLIFGSYPLRAVQYFEFSKTAEQAYDLIFSLRFVEAQNKLLELKISEPDNLIRLLLSNYIDCLTIFVSEDEVVFNRLKQNKQLRLDEIRKGDSHSPYFLFSQAEIHLQWAITRIKFEEYFQAVMEMRRAFNLLEKNAELFPQFMPNKKNLGLMHALIGTVPDKYRWGVKLLGMDGSIDEGKGEIEEVLSHARQHDFIYLAETQVMYAYLLLHLSNEKDLAWEIIEKAQIDPTTNPLACFVKANLAMRTGRNDLAIDILHNRPLGPHYFPFPHLEFMLGTAKLNRLDPDADKHFVSFLRQTKGRNYIKEAYQKLAWHAVIFDQEQKYPKYMEACKMHGAAIIDEDLSALREARQNELPVKQLLAARVLFDGGYFRRAHQSLTLKPDNLKNEFALELEYYYRKGRILHEMGHLTDALDYYERTIEKGRYEGYYFACNAALMCGKIHEANKAWDEAKSFYELTLKIKSDEYRSSLHQKAKAGLNRIAESN